MQADARTLLTSRRSIGDRVHDVLLGAEHGWPTARPPTSSRFPSDRSVSRRSSRRPTPSFGTRSSPQSGSGGGRDPLAKDGDAANPDKSDRPAASRRHRDRRQGSLRHHQRGASERGRLLSRHATRARSAATQVTLTGDSEQMVLPLQIAKSDGIQAPATERRSRSKRARRHRARDGATSATACPHRTAAARSARRRRASGAKPGHRERFEQARRNDRKAKPTASPRTHEERPTDARASWTSETPRARPASC